MLSASNNLFVEFKESSMHVLDGDQGLDIPLERDEAGRLTPSSREQASAQLSALLQARGAMSPRVAHCSIPARGVSVRRLSVPGAAKEDVERLLTLQLEAQMPIPPSELAWGCAALHGGPNGMQEFLVVAVKREFL